MAIFTSTPVSIVDPSQQSAGSAKAQASNIDGSQKTVQDPTAARLFKETSGGLLSLQQQIDQIMKALRADLPQPATISVADPTGNQIAWIGYQVINNVVYQGAWFKQIYIGGTSAATAVIASDVNGNVTITNAEIVLNGSGATITLDPVTGQIIVDGTVSSGYITTISSTGITITSTPTPTAVAHLNPTLIDCGTPGFPFANGYFKFNSLAPTGGGTTLSVRSPGGLAQLDYIPEGQLALSGPSPITNSQFLAVGPSAAGSSSLTSIAADNCAVALDADFVTPNWIARDTSVALVSKSSDTMQFIGSTGNSVNGTAALTIRALMDLSNGNFRFGGSSLPSFPVDVTGSVNVSGGYSVGGGSGLAFTTVTLAKLTTLGSNGSLGISGGIVVSYTPPT